MACLTGANSGMHVLSQVKGLFAQAAERLKSAMLQPGAVTMQQQALALEAAVLADVCSESADAATARGASSERVVDFPLLSQLISIEAAIGRSPEACKVPAHDHCRLQYTCSILHHPGSHLFAGS